jgi:PAS domain-containing protein
MMKAKLADGPSVTDTADGDLRRQIAEGRRAHEIFRVVVEATPDAIVLTNAQGRILLVNAGAEKLFGYSREELIGALDEGAIVAITDQQGRTTSVNDRRCAISKYPHEALLS